MAFATNDKGLPQEDFEVILFCAHELIHEIKSSRAGEQHRHDTLKKRVA
jgi:hypothetical protein